MKQIEKPILVSGSHRSGSTWLGRMIDLSNKTGYIHEPFNRDSGLSKELFRTWFTYVCKENEGLYREALEDYLSFKYPIIHKIKNAESLRDIGRSIRDFSLFTKYRLLKKRPLMKDPISIFSAEWLQKTFDMDVIILIRHPAAFVGSIKKAQWRTGMGNFLKQPLLMRDYLQDFESEINEHANQKKSLIDEGILLWNIIHSIIQTYQQRHKNWCFIRHEDLSRDPLQRFSDIYDFLDLNYTSDIQNKIENYSTETEEPGKLKRDSQSNIWSWKKRLSTQEIEVIYQKTKKISTTFYTDEDW